MPWIQSHVELESHPKLLVLKARMRWSKNETVGFLHRFWWTVMKYAPDGCISSLPLEVVSGTLDMKLEDLQGAVEIMKSADVRLIDERGGKLFVHDWLDYAGLYLQGSLYKRKPHLWNRVKQIYELSTDCPKTVPEPSQVPTHQPTNPPTHPATQGAGGNGVGHGSGGLGLGRALTDASRALEVQALLARAGVGSKSQQELLGRRDVTAERVQRELDDINAGPKVDDVAGVLVFRLTGKGKRR